jgi:hypothetical protein
MSRQLIVFILVIFAIHGHTHYQWTYQENPLSRVSKSLITNINILPEASEISQFMTSNWHWPQSEGFILQRWAMQNPKKNHHRTYYRPIKYQALNNIDLGQLSPAEKMDLLLNNLKWEFTNNVRNKILKFNNLDYRIALAFSESVLNFKDPLPTVFDTQIGPLPLGSSDIKAILMANHLFNYSENKILGKICKKDFLKISRKKIEPDQLEKIINSANCKGLNPGSFHLMLTNYLGTKDQGLSVDLSRDAKFKIRPVIGFVSKIDNRDQIKNTVTFTTFIKYLSPTRPTWNAYIKGNRKFMKFKYKLVLDDEDNIIGGEWISSQRPDFMIIPKTIQLRDTFKSIGPRVEKIYPLKIKLSLQKLFIQEKIYQKLKKNDSSHNELNEMIVDYIQSSKEYLFKKRKLKKSLRRINTREINPERIALIDDLASFKIPKEAGKINNKIIKISKDKSKSIFNKYIQIRSHHKNFIKTCRSNFLHTDLFEMGRLAFIQKKLLNNYFNKTAHKKVNIDKIFLEFLMEEKLYKKRNILTKSKFFFPRAKLFFDGMNFQANQLKVNPDGRIFPKKNKRLKDKFFSLNTEEINSFKLESGKYVSNLQKSIKKSWQLFLKKPISRSIASEYTYNPHSDLKDFNQEIPSQKKLKNEYLATLYKMAINQQSPILKKINQKEIINHIEQKFINEIILIEKKMNFKDYLVKKYIKIHKRKLNNIFSNRTLIDDKIKEFENYYIKKTSISKMLLDSIIKNKKDKFDLYLPNAWHDYKNKDEENALLLSIKYGKVDMLDKILKKSKYLINSENKFGQNGLFIAHINEQSIAPKTMKKIIDLLVDHDIDQNTTDIFGKKFLDYK